MWKGKDAGNVDVLVVYDYCRKHGRHWSAVYSIAWYNRKYKQCEYHMEKMKPQPAEQPGAQQEDRERIRQEESVKDEMRGSIEAGDVPAMVDTFIHLHTSFPASYSGESFDYRGFYAKEILQKAINHAKKRGGAESKQQALDALAALRPFLPSEYNGRAFDYAESYARDIERLSDVTTENFGESSSADGGPKERLLLKQILANGSEWQHAYHKALDSIGVIRRVLNSAEEQKRAEILTHLKRELGVDELSDFRAIASDYGTTAVSTNARREKWEFQHDSDPWSEYPEITHDVLLPLRGFISKVERVYKPHSEEVNAVRQQLLEAATQDVG